MATYWKSQPKKHCDFCQCWIADNRASIDFHERGKRHKENVEKKLSALRKKGHEQYKMQQTLDSDLIKMETEALKAFKKDLENDPGLAAQYKAQAAAAAASAASAAKKKEELLIAARKLHKQGIAATKQAGKATAKSSTSSTAPATEVPSHTAESTAATSAATSTAAEGSETQVTPTCVWLEGTSPEGDTYYWNTVTGESQWEKPEGYEATEESTMYKQQVPEDLNSQTQEQQEPAEETTETSQDLRPPGTEDKEPEGSEEGEEEEDESESDEDEEDEEEEKDEELVRPAKRKMVNPYGGWTTIVPDDTPPVDLQLPQTGRPAFQPIVPQAAQHQPREKVKFKERTVSSLTSASLSSSSPLGRGAAAFKKRKFGGGGRSIRQRDTDT